MNESETDLDPLASSTIIQGELWTEPRPPNSPIDNLSQLLEFQSQQNPPTQTNIMATPATNRTKEIALNKPDAYDGNRENFKKFLQDVEIYMDINHEVYKNDLIKIAFVLSFMNSGPAATWKYQFVEEKNNYHHQPIPTISSGSMQTSEKTWSRPFQCLILWAMHWTRYENSE